MLFADYVNDFDNFYILLITIKNCLCTFYNYYSKNFETKFMKLIYLEKDRIIAESGNRYLHHFIYLQCSDVIPKYLIILENGFNEIKILNGCF